MPLAVQYPHEDIYAWQPRRAWLEAALPEAVAWAASRGRTVPPIDIYPAMRLDWRDARGLWTRSNQEPRTHRIFLNESLTREDELLIVLLHELGHALEPGEHHGPRFIRCLKQLGVKRAAGIDRPLPELLPWIAAVKDRLGPFPAPTERRAKMYLPWDFYMRQVCWCADCGKTGYRTPTSSDRRDRKHPLGANCPANPNPGGLHRTVLQATLPIENPFPDLDPADRPDYTVVPQFHAPVPQDIKDGRRPAIATAWGAIQTKYDGSFASERLLGLYTDPKRAAKLACHVRGPSAHRLNTREVMLYEISEHPPGTFLTNGDHRRPHTLVRALSHTVSQLTCEAAAECPPRHVRSNAAPAPANPATAERRSPPSGLR